MALAPYLDLFNHSPDVAVSAGIGLNRAVGRAGDYQIVTRTPVRKYQQVFINYGPHDNVNLYLNYGFVPDVNVQDSFPLTLPQLLATNQKVDNVDRKVGLLKDNGLDKNMNISREGGVSWNTHACIKVA